MILGLTKRIIVVDAETSSPVDLPKHGAARYWADPKTRTLMLGFQEVTSDSTFLYEPHLHTLPGMLTQAAALPKEECMFAAFNAAFDHKAVQREGIDTPKDKWIDIMLLAYILAFSGKLDEVLKQFNVRDRYGRPLRKSAEGKRLINLFCKQETPWYDDPARWSLFCDYCRNDVFVEVALLRKCLAVLDQPAFHPMIATLQRQWLMNQRINDRGIPVSTETINGALKLQAYETKRLMARMKELTGLSNPNSVQQLIAWCAKQGYPMPNMQAPVIRDVLDDPEMPEVVAEVLTARIAIGSASVKKFQSMSDKQVNGRINNAYTLCGASRTGRDASRGINLANMERPKLSQKGWLADPNDPSKGLADLSSWVADWIETGDPSAVDFWVGGKQGLMPMLGSSVRGAIKAPLGYGITAIDLKSIESVGLAFLAGCQTILKLFHEGKDTYKDFGTRYYGIVYEEVTKAQRGFCKPPVLGCGFGASGTALVIYAKNIGVIMDEDTANRMVQIFRTSFPEIPLLWRNLETSAKNAIRNPGTPYFTYAVETFSEYGAKFHTYRQWPRVAYFYDGTFLHCTLPSGRTLFYYKPEILKVKRKSKTPDIVDTVVYDDFGAPRVMRSTQEAFYFQDSLHYWGKDQDKSGAWTFISTWGGGLAENVTQAMCRDVLYAGLEKIDADPLIELVGSTYDESINLTRLDDATAYDRILGYMTERLPWMDEGFYLGADGYHNAARYRKD